MTLGTIVEVNKKISGYDKLLVTWIEKLSETERYVSDHPEDREGLLLHKEVLEDIMYYHKMVYTLSRLRRAMVIHSRTLQELARLDG